MTVTVVLGLSAASRLLLGLTLPFGPQVPHHLTV